MPLDRCADNDAQSGRYGNALHVSKFRDHDEIVELLRDMIYDRFIEDYQ